MSVKASERNVQGFPVLEKVISAEIGILTSDCENITIIRNRKKGNTMDKFRNGGSGE